MLRVSLVLITGALFVGAALARAATSYIYVESNVGSVPDQNSIYAFANDGLGNLVALPGSPYLTGGTGNSAPGDSDLDADQEVIANQDGSVLYAVNARSNSIAAFRVNADGTLTTIPGSPYASGGRNPVSIGLAGKFMVVANKNFDPQQNIERTVPNYTTFTVKRNGGLVMNPGSTLDLAPGSGPSQALVSNRKPLLFGLEFFTSRIVSYSYNLSGLMSEVSSISPPSGLFLGEILHPRQRVLYAGLLSTNELGVYTFDGAGVLSFVSAVANDGIGICWLRTNATGTRLYTSESVSTSVTVYDITDPLNPVQVQQVTLNTPDGPAVNIELDPTGQFLYVLSGNGIHTLNVAADGLLTETVPRVVLPTSIEDSPIGLAIIRK